MSTETLAEENVAESTEDEATENRELAGYAEKAPTHLHEGYAVYLKEKVGYGPEAPAEGEVATDEWKHFVKTIQLAVVLYGRYQKSPENAARKVVEAQERDAKADEAKEARARAAEEKKAAAAAAKEKADAAKAAEGEKAPSKAATKPKGTKPKGAASTVEAPF